MEEYESFGSDKFFNQLRREINSKTPSDAAIYGELVRIIKKDTRKMLREKLPGVVNDQNREDALQDICISVLLGIYVFLNNSVDKTPEQRQAWLKSIAQRRIADIVDKNYTKETRKTALGEVETVTVYKTDSLDDENKPELVSREHSIEKMYLDRFASEKTVRVFSELMKQDVALDRLMSFFYAKIIIPQKLNRYSGDTFSGKVEETVNLLSGRSMEDIVKAFPKDFCVAYQQVFPSEMFKVLEKKLTEERDANGTLWKDVTFSLDYKKVLDASNRVLKRLRKINERHKDEE